MTQYQRYFGTFRISGTMRRFSILNFTSSGNAACMINSNIDLLICGYSGETKQHLCEYVQNTIRGQSNHANAVCNYSPSTGRVSLYLKESANVVWTDIALGDALGFNSMYQNAAQVHTAQKSPRYTWSPSRGIADCPVHVNTWWGKRSTSKVTRSQDGTVRGTRGNVLNDGRYSYRVVPREDVVCDPMNTADNYRSFEQFFEDVITRCSVVRVYTDRSTMNSTSYKEGVITDGVATDGPIDVGALDTMISKTQPPWDVLYDVDFSMIRNV